ncbi:MAG: flagellar motor protein MotA, partial [Proteobacteria bacterium]|nr:flagellar motor protein MotA [Pseudomonadota bacterium]
SGITELSPSGAGANTNDYISRQLLSAVVEMQRSLEDFANRVVDQTAGPAKGTPAQDDVRDLARGVNQLVTQMRSEQKVVREWVDEQAQSQAEVAHMLRNLADAMKRGV